MPKDRVPVDHQGRALSGINSIPPDKLVRLMGTPKCPVLPDVRNAARLALHNAFDRWCRDTADETHTGLTNKPERWR